MRRSQVQPWYGEGNLAERPSPNEVPLGYLYHCEDTGDSFVRAINLTTGEPQWDPLGAGGAGALSGKYWVNVAGEEPITPYQLPSQAIAAAVADGHDGAHPATIMVLPGQYIEASTVVLPPGINIQGFGPAFVNMGLLIQTATFTSVQEIFFNGTIDVGTGVASSGEVILDRVVAKHLSVNDNGVQVDGYTVDFENSSTSAIEVHGASTVVNISNTSKLSAPVGQPAIDVVAGNVNARQSTLRGGWAVRTFAAASIVTVDDCDIALSGSPPTAAYHGTPGATFVTRDCRYTGVPADGFLLENGGSIFFDDLDTDNVMQLDGSATSNVAVKTQRTYSYAFAQGNPIALAALAETIECSFSGLPFTVNLPQSTRAFNGFRVCITNGDHVASNMTIKPFAGDTIAGSSASIVPLGTSVFLQLHGNDWIMVAQGPQIIAGTGSPNTVVFGSPGDLYVDQTGGAGVTLWVKESGTNSNTGWASK